MRGRVLLTVLWLTASGFEWSGKLQVDARGLRDPSPQRRIQAIQALADYDIAESKLHLIAVLGDGEESVRVEAARVLARHHVAEAVGPVSEWLSAFEKSSRI